jgi:ferredoxin
MQKRLIIDEDLCIGCGHCAEVCPKVFLVEDEKSHIIAQDQCWSCNCQEALDACPVQAISWA